jgi:oxygen-independent coproporphyrinogen-3 oxidase
MERRFGLYVHIPYCRTKCPYCDFNSHAAASWPERRYADALAAELARHAGVEPWRGGRVETIFFGGGTPSLFSPETIGRVLDAVAARFDVAPGAEVTLEANPGTVTAGKLAGFRAAGIGRVSFGIQSFHPHLLKLLGRLHTVDDTRRAVPLAREAGFEEVSVDLIFAVPGQTLDEWRADLDTAIAFRPEHVSAYNLTYEEGTPFFAMRRDGRLRPLDDEIEAAMFLEARERLGRAGYRAYEVSNFALPGHEARHNLNYWHAGAYLGIGAGAVSSHPVAGGGGRRWTNEKDPARYMSRALRDGDAATEVDAIDGRQSRGEFAFLNLRLADGFTEAAFRERFGVDVEEVFPNLEDVVGPGLVDRRDGRLALTPRGLLVGDSVFATFL